MALYSEMFKKIKILHLEIYIWFSDKRLLTNKIAKLWRGENKTRNQESSL